MVEGLWREGLVHMLIVLTYLRFRMFCTLKDFSANA